jgi:hypothetical protein
VNNVFGDTNATYRNSQLSFRLVVGISVADCPVENSVALRINDDKTDQTTPGKLQLQRTLLHPSQKILFIMTRSTEVVCLRRCISDKLFGRMTGVTK